MNPEILEAIRAQLRAVPAAVEAIAAPEFGELYRYAAMRSAFTVAEAVESVAGQNAPDEAVERELAALLRNSRSVRRRGRQPLAWELDEAVRRQCFQGLFAACGREPDRFAGELRRRLPFLVQERGPFERMLSAYARLKGPPLDTQTGEELAATLRVAELLAGTLHDLPSAEAVRAARQRAELLAPFRWLTENFRGRSDELRQLQEYVEWLPAQTLRDSVRRTVRTFLDLRKKPPLVIHGVGGVGKTTLVAQFVLDHLYSSRDARSLPFVYIDFDQPGISLREPLTFLLESMRQLALQFPEKAEPLDRLRSRMQHDLSAIAEGLRRTEEGVRVKLGSFAEYVGSHRDEQSIYFTEFADLWRDMTPPDGALLVLLDSFEEAQSRSASLLPGLFSLLQVWSREIPRLRVVIAGRAQVTEFPTESLPVGELDPEAAVGFLRSHGVGEEGLARHIAERFGRNPLTLQLAASIVRREGVAARYILDEVRVRNWFHVRVNTLRVQQELVRRNLTHLHDADVEKLAMPGLVVRRVSAELIREVLAVPCGLEEVTPERAAELFDQLRQEVAIVARTQEGNSVRYLTELRQALLPLVTMEEPVRVRAIHDAAVDFYARRDGAAARAEEIYHRLSRGDYPAEVKGRLVPGVDAFLRGALGELPAGAHVFLANQFGWSVPPEVKDAVVLSAWEEAEAQDLRAALYSGALAALILALQRLTARRERTERSPLYPWETILYERLGLSAQATLSGQAALATARAGGQGTDAWALLITLARVGQRAGEWDYARRNLRQAMTVGGHLGRWDWVTLAGLELLRVHGRIGGGRFPQRFFLRAVGQLGADAEPEEVVAPATRLMFTLLGFDGLRSSLYGVLRDLSAWHGTILPAAEFIRTVDDVLQRCGSDEKLGDLVTQVFSSSYREIGRVPGEEHVKAFDIVQFAETTSTLDRLRAFLYPRAEGSGGSGQTLTGGTGPQQSQDFAAG